MWFAQHLAGLIPFQNGQMGGTENPMSQRLEALPFARRLKTVLFEGFIRGKQTLLGGGKKTFLLVLCVFGLFNPFSKIKFLQRSRPNV